MLTQADQQAPTSRAYIMCRADLADPLLLKINVRDWMRFLK